MGTRAGAAPAHPSSSSEARVPPAAALAAEDEDEDEELPQVRGCHEDCA